MGRSRRIRAGKQMVHLPRGVAHESVESEGGVVLSFLFPGGLFIFNGTLWCLILVSIASAMSRRLRQHRSSGMILKRATGAVFVGLGVRLATSK
jgi:threonine/homoserine/homoserine lactone efflux protein